MFKKILKLLLLALLIIIVIVITKTLLLTPKTLDTADLKLPPINKEQVVANLSQSIKFDTVSRFNSYDSSVERTVIVNEKDFEAFHLFLEQAYPLVHQKLALTKINQYSLLYRWDGSKTSDAPIVLTGHQDVVPVFEETKSQWKHQPFAGDVTETHIWGRGALDDKSSVLATLEAVELLLVQGFTPKKTIYLAFGHDEELGGLLGAKAIADHLKAKDIKPVMVLDEGGFVLSKLVPGVTEPVGMIGIAEKGYLNLSLSVKGTEGHSSMPPKQTAIGILSSAIAKLESNPSPVRYEGATKALFDSVSPHMPFKQRMVFANMWLFKPVVMGILKKGNATNATLRSTFAVTIIDGGLKDNILPASAKANINVRLLPGDSADDIVKYAQNIIADDRVTVEGSLVHNEASSVSSIESAEYKSLETVISQVFKKDKVVVAPYLTINGTDSKHYSEIADNTYRFLPISLDSEGIKLIHGVNENISIDNYIRMIQFYVALIEHY